MHKWAGMMQIDSWFIIEIRSRRYYFIIFSRFFLFSPLFVVTLHIVVNKYI